MKEILEGIALVLTPVAAVLGARYAYKAKVNSVVNRKDLLQELSTGNGHSIGQAVANIEEKQHELSERIYKNSEEIAKTRNWQQAHLYTYFHERRLVDE